MIPATDLFVLSNAVFEIAADYNECGFYHSVNIFCTLTNSLLVLGTAYAEQIPKHNALLVVLGDDYEFHLNDELNNNSADMPLTVIFEAAQEWQKGTPGDTGMVVCYGAKPDNAPRPIIALYGVTPEQYADYIKSLYE